MLEKLSKLGATIGNLNDSHSRHDSRSGASLRWRLVDKVVGSLYALPDRV